MGNCPSGYSCNAFATLGKACTPPGSLTPPACDDGGACSLSGSTCVNLSTVGLGSFCVKMCQ
jgi:hypothetical protein